jgi:uncharacterized membrane protein
LTPTLSERVMAIGRKIGLDDDKGYIVAIGIALLVVALVVAGYYLVYDPKPAAYNTIYVLDSQHSAVDYPVTLIVNQNSTFSVYVTAENHMGGSGNQTYQVLVKVTQSLSGFPVDVTPSQTYNVSLANGAGWTTQSTLTLDTLDQPGSYAVVYELWHYNADPSVQAYQFTNDEAVLHIQVIS